MNDQNPWTTLSIQEAYDNPWIRVSHREVLNPNGAPGIYGLVHFKNIAVGIIPVDEQGFTWLVGQYRYALGRFSWEIPEGGCPVDEAPLDAAKRELREETGLSATYWEKILECDLSNSVTDEKGVIFVATGLQQGEWAPEDTEQLHLRRLPLKEAISMVYSGEIRDALSIMGLLCYTVK